MGIRGFGSDNNSGVHPLVLKKITEATYGHALSYGADPYTKKLEESFKEMFGDKTQTFLVYNGTAANVLGLSALLHSYEAVICAESAHINVDECGALEAQLGSKILTVPTFNGKITIDAIEGKLHSIGDQHRVQPKVISITQPTELGTLYTKDEIKALADFAHENGLYLHMDGARFGNAVAALGCEPKEISSEAGVDVLSFGGTKNGMMFGEAVLFFVDHLPKEIKYLRKQSMQLHSKGRFIAAQFCAMLENDLWLKCASHANEMAAKLGREAENIDCIRLTQEVESNQVFAIVPRTKVEQLKEHYFFYTWDKDSSEVRWVCSFDTTESDIIDFVNVLREMLC